MNANTIVIPLSFLILTALLLWLIIDVRGKWLFKVMIMFLVVAFSTLVWKSLDSYLGWPTSAALPERSILIWVSVVEPSPKLEEPGAIYLWLKPREALPKRIFFGYNPSPNDPRVYKLPYSRSLHKDTQRALEGIIGDKSIEVRLGGRGGKYEGGGFGGDAPGSVKFYLLPPVKLPPKINH